jgi:hypothetical protein
VGQEFPAATVSGEFAEVAYGESGKAKRQRVLGPGEKCQFCGRRGGVRSHWGWRIHCSLWWQLVRFGEMAGYGDGGNLNDVRFWDPEDPLVDGELRDGWTVLAGLEYWEVNLFLGMENERFGRVLISKEEERRGREDE